MLQGRGASRDGATGIATQKGIASCAESCGSGGEAIGIGIRAMGDARNKRNLACSVR
jgi:hypothetical protein